MDEIGPTDLGFRLDIKQILSEAQHRWLRPAEICEILRNYQQFHISPEAPSKPISGSVFLFDRKVLRYFRKDGHNWRKKKDGKTVKEAHEKLKVGSVDMLHCYYAHGEDNENFQRRSYWLLEEDLMHIVFVHYLEVKGNKTNTSFSGNTERVISNSETDSGISSSFRGTSPTSALSSAYEDAESDANFQASSEFHSFPRYPASPITDDSYSAQSSSYNLVPSPGGHGNGNFAGSTVVSKNQAVDSITWQLLGNHTAGEASYNQGPGPTYPVQSNLQLSSGGYLSNVHSQALNLPGSSKSNLFEEKTLPSNQVDELGSLLRQSEEGGQLGNLKSLLLDANTGRSMNLDMGNSLMTLGNENLFLKKPMIGGFQADESLKKVDSFSRWMAKELGEDDELNMHSTSNGSTWSIMGNECDSNIPTQLQVDTDALNPSISQDQLFSISDFTPNWAYSGLELTVLITGTFLKSEQELSKYEFSVMFGEVEVPADVLADGILSCNAPVHRPGLVPFYITRSNRVACSEIREFEYKHEPDGNANYIDTSDDKVFAMHLYRRFEMILSLESVASPATAVRNDFEKQNVLRKITSLMEEENKYDAMPILGKDGSLIKLAEQVLERKLKEKFYAWLLRITTEDGKGPRILDEWGQSVLHLAGALGFNWVFEPVIASGVSIDFRDVNGWTALHWAAFYGREETVAALISLGAAPGALTDPCVTYPLGRSPADLASFGGHKGISGFLAETTLTTQLSTLTVNDNGNAPVPEMQAVETISDRKAVSTNEEDVSDSLAAFRNAAQAAARIHEIFRLKSFRRKQVIEQSSDDISDEQCVSLVASKTSRLGAADRATNAAAVRIQKKFRGYKKRKEFLMIRQKVVKIQAHVRGHQVRKKYKPIIWTVGIVEKAILRWRRKRSGFRGFKPNEARTEPNSQSSVPQEDDYDFLKDGRKQNEERMEKALERVKSMAQYPEARAQYRRLLNAAEGLREPKDDISDIIPDNFGDMNFPEEELLDVESLWDDDTFMSLTFQ